MSLRLVGGTRAFIKCANFHKEEVEEEGGHGRSSRLWAVGLEGQEGHGRTHGRSPRLWGGGVEEEQTGKRTFSNQLRDTVSTTAPEHFF